VQYYGCIECAKTRRQIAQHRRDCLKRDERRRREKSCDMFDEGRVAAVAAVDELVCFAIEIPFLTIVCSF
jgi:hypothetical protein